MSDEAKRALDMLLDTPAFRNARRERVADKYGPLPRVSIRKGTDLKDGDFIISCPCNTMFEAMALASVVSVNMDVQGDTNLEFQLIETPELQILELKRSDDDTQWDQELGVLWFVVFHPEIAKRAKLFIPQQEKGESDEQA